MWIQLLTGAPPSDNDTVTGSTSGASADINGAVTERPVLTPFYGASTGSSIIGAFGFGVEATDLTSNDSVIDLSGTTIAPPNFVTFSVGGLVSGEDRVLVAPWDGVSTDPNNNPAIDTDQMTLNTTLNGAAETQAVMTGAIPSDTPSAGTIRIVTDGGGSRRVPYSSWSGSTFTFTSAENFTGDNATAGNDVWISYLDVLAASATEAVTVVFNSTRDVLVLVRDGGGTPIKEFITSAQITSNGGSVTAIRTTDT